MYSLPSRSQVAALAAVHHHLVGQFLQVGLEAGDHRGSAISFRCCCVKALLFAVLPV